MPSQREIAAHHEAGHAVVALAFCATGLRGSIRCEAPSGGIGDCLPQASNSGRVFSGFLSRSATSGLVALIQRGGRRHRNQPGTGCTGRGGGLG
jgi:hypothetical protein